MWYVEKMTCISFETLVQHAIYDPHTFYHCHDFGILKKCEIAELTDFLRKWQTNNELKHAELSIVTKFEVATYKSKSCFWWLNPRCWNGLGLSHLKMGLKTAKISDLVILVQKWFQAGSLIWGIMCVCCETEMSKCKL